MVSAPNQNGIQRECSVDDDCYAVLPFHCVGCADFSHSPQPVDEIDIELDRLRGDMGMNQMKTTKPKPSLTDLAPKRKPKQKRDI